MTQSKRLLVFSGRDPLAARLRQLTSAWSVETVATRSFDELCKNLAVGEHDMVLVEGPEAVRGLSGGKDGDEALNLPLAEVEKRHLLRVLAAHNGNKTRAARSLGIDTKTLYNKLKSYETSAALARRRLQNAASGGGAAAAVGG
ncbi:MAG: hypothetical protein RL398_2072 [Planctomycetota bacterium]|jgi:DNA-binding NtrC family response regulator